MLPYSSPLDGYSGILPQVWEPLADKSAYSKTVGSPGHSSNSTRVDITFAVSQLGAYNSSPVQRHRTSVCRVFGYLLGASEYSTTYSYGPKSCDYQADCQATIFSDADFAADVTTRRSVPGPILMMGGGPVCWKSRKLKAVSTSTAEAEYVALSEASKQAIWAKRFLTELHVADKLFSENRIAALSDNQSALAIVKGSKSSKAKHIDISFHPVRECIEKATYLFLTLHQYLCSVMFLLNLFLHRKRKIYGRKVLI